MRAVVVVSILLAPLLGASSAAHASSDRAWAAFNAKVQRRCAAASGLGGARSSAVVGFDDTLGKVATLVTGAQRLADGRTATIRKLCVFDQRSGQTWTSEAPGWSAPPR